MKIFISPDAMKDKVASISEKTLFKTILDDTVKRFYLKDNISGDIYVSDCLTESPVFSDLETDFAAATVVDDISIS